MAFTRVSPCVVALLFSIASAQSNSFLRKVSTREIQNDLESSLAAILSGHASEAASARLATIEGSIWQTFQSLPKNTQGRLAKPAVRHIVHGYFAQAHGWQIKGLESFGMPLNSTDVQEPNIMQDKAPLLVEGLLEARHQDHGLSLTDVVAMVAVLEQLVFDESVTLLEAAYRLNVLSVAEQIDADTLHRVLLSYLVLFGLGSKADLFDVALHQDIMARNLKYASRAKRQAKVDFEHNAVLNFEYARRHRTNPFVPRRYSFDVVAEIVTDLAQRYGQWQNFECLDIKAHLVELDSEGTGRVPLGLLYAQPRSDTFHFSESADYLRQIGALDETSSTPMVIIANYIVGPSNCIASSSYYSVCCLSNCDSVMDEIEHKVLAPMASPQRLLDVVRSISKELPQGLPEKLQKIAERHGGDVPLHGRLFAQWLHFAFPHECPYPAILQNTRTLAASAWHPAEYVASGDERMEHVLGAQVSSSDGVGLSELWSDHEVLPVMDAMPEGSTTAATVRVIVQLAAVLLILRSVLSAFQSATGPGAGKSKKMDSKKDDDLVMGLCV